MKKTILLVFSFSLLVFLGGCDKIESDQYWVYSGVSGQWQDYSGAVDPQQRVFVEKYTGVGCVNCPKADTVLHEALDKYHGNLILVAVHAGPFANPIGSDPSLSCPEAEAWHQYFGISAEPAAILMRSKAGAGAWDIFTPTSNFDDRIDAALGSNSPIALSVAPFDTAGNTYARVAIEYKEDLSTPLSLTIVATEDSLLVTQKSSSGRIENYPENHVLRCAITDPWGLDVVADGKQGTKRCITLPLDIRNVTNTSRCHIVAFISEKDSRRILNAATFKL